MTKGNTNILSGFCPNSHCQKKLFFPDNEVSVECPSCGQRHIQSSLVSLESASSPSRPDLVEAIETLLHQLRKIDADASKKNTLEKETFKINGLSNYLCTIISPLLTTYGMDKASGKAKLLTDMGKPPVFDCGQLCDRSFLIDPAHMNIPGFGRDRSGSSIYLKDTLNVIKLSNENEERLVPIHADGDGHCLVHSVSRALVGWQLFWHPLRVNLKQHFINNLDKYKMQFKDFIDDREWPVIIEECDPDFAPSGLEQTGLRNIHIFGLANVLKRPIILLDCIEGIQSPGDYSAIFLPVFSTPAACRNKEGVLNTPLCIAWSSQGRNHFIPLVGVKGRKCPMLSRHMIQRAWGVSDIEIDRYVQFDQGLCQIGGEKGLQISYVQRLVSATNQVFLQHNQVCASLVADIYQHIFKANGLVFGVNLSVLLDKAKRSTADQQLFICLACRSLNLAQPLPQDHDCFQPGGELYKLAVSCHGKLKDGQKYSFPLHDVVAKYDSVKDCLNPVNKNEKPSRCSYCSGLDFRLVKADYTILYQNGDRTQTSSTVCSCGFKHFWNGQEHDTAPQEVLVVMQWSGRVVNKTAMWFENESEPGLNSNVYQLAQELVQNSFPGEFGSERLTQQVVDQILVQINNPSRAAHMKSLLDKFHLQTATSNAQADRLPSPHDLPLASEMPERKVVDMEKSSTEAVKTEPEQCWSSYQPSKALISGRQTQSIHKEELTKSQAERELRQKINKNAEIQQRKSHRQKTSFTAKTSGSNPRPDNSPSSSKQPQPSPHTAPPPLTTCLSTNPTPSSSSSPSSSPLTSTTASPGHQPQKSTTSISTKKQSELPSQNKRIRLSVSDGRNLTLDLPAKCTVREIQALILKHTGIPLDKQKIRHGFPPVELRIPSPKEEDNPVPIQPGDRIRVDVIGDGLEAPPRLSPTVPKSAWSLPSSSADMNEVSDRVLQRLMDPLLGNGGGDNLDRSLSALALTAALEQKDLWTYVQRLPHLFSVDGLFYKQVARDMGLEHGKHCTLPLLPHKVFVYNAQAHRLELCLEPYGHFPVESGVESKAQSLLLPSSSFQCRSKTGQQGAPFSGQGHSLRSMASQEDRMPTDVPMSPKRHEARRVNSLCDPNIHQESIEEEDEEGDEAIAMATNISSSLSSPAQPYAPPLSSSSHQLRPSELIRPPVQKGMMGNPSQPPSSLIHDGKLIRKGPGYSELLSPIQEDWSGNKQEMLHSLVSRIEQAVKSMGQDEDETAPVPPRSLNILKSDWLLAKDDGRGVVESAMHTEEMSSSKTCTDNVDVPGPVQQCVAMATDLFPSAEALQLAGSLSGSNSSLNRSSQSSAGGDLDMEEGGTKDFQGEDQETNGGLSKNSIPGLPAEGEESIKNRVAAYAEEVASGILAMDSDGMEEQDVVDCVTGTRSTCVQDKDEERNKDEEHEEEEEMDSSDTGVVTSS